MATNEQAAELDRLLRHLVSLTASVPKAAPQRFSGTWQALADVSRLASKAVELQLVDLPSWATQMLVQQVGALISATAAVQDHERPKPGQKPGLVARDAVWGSLEASLTGDTLKNLYFAFSYLSFNAAEFAGTKARAEQAASEVQLIRSRWEEYFQAAGNEARRQQQESQSLIRSLRAIAGESGVSKFAGTFGKVARSSRNASWFWIALSLAFAACVIGAAYEFMCRFHVPGDLVSFTNVYILVTRLVVIGTFAAASAWCASMYRVRAHLAEVNQHRAAALRTYRLFLKSAEGNTARDKILEVSLNTIFAPAVTGLVDAKNEKAHNEALKLLEMAMKLK